MSKKNRMIQEQNNGQDRAVVAQRASFSGPIPPPQFLAEYNKIVPGSAEIIINMAKEQATHRQELEKKVINSDIDNSKKGLWFGFIIGMTGIIIGAFIIYAGQVIAGSIISGGTLATLVGTFVYGSQGRKKEREEKNK